MKELTTTHAGIEITYDEAQNIWTFELRGRERSAPSLLEAKAAIERPAPKDKKPFTRIKCWKLETYNTKAKQVEVTSMCDRPSWDRQQQFWVMDGKVRERHRASDLFPCGSVNDSLIAQIERRHEDAAKIQEQIEALKKKLKPLAVEPE